MKSKGDEKQINSKLAANLKISLCHAQGVYASLYKSYNFSSFHKIEFLIIKSSLSQSIVIVSGV